MLKIFVFLFGSIIILSCSGGNYEKNLKELDEVYGMCENPMRSLSTRKYKECIAAERANNESFFEINKDLNNLFNRGGNGNYVVQYTVNPSLWQAALNITEKYPLKIADNQGGYIETDWINQKESPNNRCLIKVRITSQDLVSNGVTTKFICEEKIDNQWVANNDSYSTEEKQFTLKILSAAADISQNTL